MKRLRRRIRSLLAKFKRGEKNLLKNSNLKENGKNRAIEKPNVILQSGVIENQRGTGYRTREKRIYIDCSCGCYGDAARIVLSQTFMRDRNGLDYETDVSFEFDVRGSTEISRDSYKVSTFLQRTYMRFDQAQKRFFAALRILTGRPVYLPNSLLINFEGAKCLCRAILSSIEGLEKDSLSSCQ